MTAGCSEIGYVLAAPAIIVFGLGAGVVTMTRAKSTAPRRRPLPPAVEPSSNELGPARESAQFLSPRTSTTIGQTNDV
jgi:hypothetical protein